MAANVIIAGDCGPAHGPNDGFPVRGYIDLIAPTLRAADFRLVNCMRTYSTNAAENSDAPQVAQPVEMAELYTHAGFDGITMANNHAFDAGPQAMIDTVNLFRERGIQVTGAGRNFADASKPVIMEKEGLRIAYLGCTSLGKAQGSAGPITPGVLNVSINTSYEHRGPHAPVRILTSPDQAGLDQLLSVVRKLRPSVDRLIIAFHSGVIRVPRVVSDYQVTIAHALIDAGADLIVCHAPHIPKGIEVYKGKVIFYSIGVFAMTKPFAAPSWSEPAWSHGAIRNHMDLDPDYPFMPYGTDSRFALLVKADFAKDDATRVSFLPVFFDQTYRPRALEAGDPLFTELVEYLEWASVDMVHTFTVEGNEVVVTA
ncbi:CapA family protein [Rhizobium leguminosarum]|uniref:CapA family protein n=1 Tax=Rhizobium leguminosarum TaxID=384 RepID=UPI0024B384F3|nr:CapA family protein [Rhizobium leguminosarum]WHO82734.1 CapA family protein [Rhizobium leguminosarum]